MVSTRPPRCKSSRPFNNPLVIVPKAPITIGIILTFMFHSFFQFSSKAKVLFIFFQFDYVVYRDSNVDNFPGFLSFFLFFVAYYKVWSSGRDYVIRLYIKDPQVFVRVIFKDRCWVVHIPFVGMVRFQFLAHFPVDHLGHPVVASFVLLC